MHSMAVPASVLAIARAGAGTNNIPVPAHEQARHPGVQRARRERERGEGAGARRACSSPRATSCRRGTSRARSTGDDEAIDKAVEAGKKKFVGFEMPGRTLGVVGLGAIGVEVANSALALGMKVLGYDPQITVQRAWQLSSNVEQALSLDDLFARCDAITVHVPLNNDTRGLVNAARLKLMKKGGVILNFSRAAIVDDKAVIAALDDGRLHAYVCDFPKNALKVASEGRHAAASGCVHGRGRRELRRDGRGHAAGLPRERQHPQQRELPGSRAAARAECRAPVHRQQQRARTWSARSPRASPLPG